MSAARPSHTCVLEQLWASRYHVAAQILAAGVNLMHVDTDSIFLTDPYALLKAPPLDAISLLILPEAPAKQTVDQAHAWLGTAAAGPGGAHKGAAAGSGGWASTAGGRLVSSIC